MDSMSKAKTVNDPHGSGAQAQPKRKRKSPAVPWKKPKDMPKRPLSAYNLFFKDERERILGSVGTAANPEANRQLAQRLPDQTGPEPAGPSDGKPVKKKRRRRRVSLGIGFANLAKSIAAKWNELDPASKAPYLDIAGREKAKYDEAVAQWRIDQKKMEKGKTKDSPDSKSESKHESTMSVASVASVPSDKSMLSLEPVEGGAYPATWFRSSVAEESDHSEATKKPAVPKYIDTLNDESARTASSELTMQVDARRHHSEPEASESTFHPAHLNEAFLPGSPAITTMEGLPFSAENSPIDSPGQAVHAHSRLANDMANIQRELEDLRRTRASLFGESHSSPLHSGRFPGQMLPAPPALLRPTGRTFGGHASQDLWGYSTYQNRMHPPSLPPSRHNNPHPYHPSPPPPGGPYFHNPATLHAAHERRVFSSPSPASRLPSSTPRIAREEDALVDTSLHSLSQRLDDDTIDFLTSAFFNRGPT
ncbi:hypothetical protein FisN_6Hh048 [Fistulifera solaris]|jgi:hypothetical protein|uniref:HMG box domain-containing protein n=1 Tax=Fistulifera solaris TaxID=1519565 RepID=A0A1Z5KHX3_FISSO|nr:hypothetical protein FisN_6Hh048 [Fistulifera solaris]|eukprot:GAX25914.1 hypothetical protein FisN_6Hh048 [Fistulifera solaris]